MPEPFCEHMHAGRRRMTSGVFTMKTFLKTFLNDESGASAAEYALILAIVGTGIAIAALSLGGAISVAMTKAATCITTPNTTNCGATVAPPVVP